MSIVALAQMTSSTSIQANLQEVKQLLQTAHAQNAELIVLPENFACMGLANADKLAYAESISHGEIQALLSQLAKQYNLWIIAGTMPIKGHANRVRASSLVYDNNGKYVARYDKIHLFDVRVSEQEAHQESLTIEPGNELTVVETPVGKIGLSVCYDLRFPELYRYLVEQGAELLTVPSAFTAITGAAHWEVLLRARAIENLCYVLAPNQTGQHENGRQTYGHSMIVEPWGKIIAQQEQGTGVVSAEIDLQKLHQLRRQFPCNDHHILSLT